MNQHFHHDIIEFAWIGVSAVVFINLMRLFAAQLVARNIGAGTAIGSLVR